MTRPFVCILSSDTSALDSIRWKNIVMMPSIMQLIYHNFLFVSLFCWFCSRMNSYCVYYNIFAVYFFSIIFTFTQNFKCTCTICSKTMHKILLYSLQIFRVFCDVHYRLLYCQFFSQNKTWKISPTMLHGLSLESPTVLYLLLVIFFCSAFLKWYQFVT